MYRVECGRRLTRKKRKENERESVIREGGKGKEEKIKNKRVEKKSNYLQTPPSLVVLIVVMMKKNVLQTTQVIKCVVIFLNVMFHLLIQPWLYKFQVHFQIKSVSDVA